MLKDIRVPLLWVIMGLSLGLFVSEPIAQEIIEYEGLIEPHLVVKVGSPVVGIIETVTVDRGDRVTKGQVLVTLQSGVEKATMALARARAELEASIKAKRAELEFAQRNQQRIKSLYDKNALPLQEWDTVETKRILAELQLAEALENKRLAELEFNQAQEVVQRKIILSPFDGVVEDRFLNVGEYVENQPIFKLAEIDPLNVEVILPVSMWSRVKPGMRATIKPEAPVGGSHSAGVTIIDRVIDAASGTFGVRLELPNPELRLPPGLKCKIIFHEK
ncbi:MAG: efflux RND transporter periplasmic adaptor subunit [Desulfobacterales bacterium]|nr:efflux RND transporter periplasmic adaptor subunit [Desulfobacterales bacterium]